jgi:hypothetical protein
MEFMVVQGPDRRDLSALVRTGWVPIVVIVGSQCSANHAGYSIGSVGVLWLLRWIRNACCHLGARLGQPCCGVATAFVRDVQSSTAMAPDMGSSRCQAPHVDGQEGQAVRSFVARPEGNLDPQSAFRACLPGTFRQLHAGLPQRIHLSARVIRRWPN